jgi:hypothetical protein
MNKIQNKINHTVGTIPKGVGTIPKGVGTIPKGVGTIPKGNIRIIKRGKTISLTHNLHMTVDFPGLVQAHQ